MTNIYLVAAFWFLSALISTIIANRLKISNALMEIIIGAVIGFIAFKVGFTNKLALDTDWMKFLAGLAAIMLTFLSGTELNPDSLKSKFKVPLYQYPGGSRSIPHSQVCPYKEMIYHSCRRG